MRAAGLVRRLVISLVALHSIALGWAMLLYPRWTLALCGWEYAGGTFFPAQSGLFLLLLGGAYAAAIQRRSFAWFLVVSKAVAVVFLIAENFRGTAPDRVLVAAVLDGLMGTSVAIACIWEARSRRASGTAQTQAGPGSQ